MPGFPYIVAVEVAWNDPAFSVSPTWHNLGSSVGVDGFFTFRGRVGNSDNCEPGYLSVTLDDPAMILDPDNTASPFYGNLRTMRRIRVWAQQTAFTDPVYLFHGWIDRIARLWPGGGAHSVVTINATDQFKILARRTLPAFTFAASTASARLDAIYGAAGTFAGVPAGQFNTPGYASYTVVEHAYAGENALQALNDIALSDGGVFFIAGNGTPFYHSYGYRSSDVRATASNATFGNSPGAITVEEDFEPYIDDVSMANTVHIQAGDAQELTVSYGPGVTQDETLEFDLGSTLLVPIDADARAADYALYRALPRVNYDTVTLDCVTGDDQMTQALAREISDRVTIALTPQGGGVATSRDQFIEAVSHDVQMPGTWSTTFALSAV